MTLISHSLLFLFTSKVKYSVCEALPRIANLVLCPPSLCVLHSTCITRICTKSCNFTITTITYQNVSLPPSVQTERKNTFYQGL